METKVVNFPAQVSRPLPRARLVRCKAPLQLVSPETAKTLRVIEVWQAAADARKKIANELSKRALRRELAQGSDPHLSPAS